MYTPSHLEASLLFALFASTVMGLVGRSNDRERVYYGLYCFGYFLVAIFALASLMRLGHG